MRNILHYGLCLLCIVLFAPIAWGQGGTLTLTLNEQMKESFTLNGSGVDLTHLTAGKVLYFSWKKDIKKPENHYADIKITEGDAKVEIWHKGWSDEGYKVTMGSQNATLSMAWKEYRKASYVLEKDLNVRVILSSDGESYSPPIDNRVLYGIKPGEKVVVSLNKTSYDPYEKNEEKQFVIECNVTIKEEQKGHHEYARYSFIMGEEDVTLTIKEKPTYKLVKNFEEGIDIYEYAFSERKFYPGDVLTFFPKLSWRALLKFSVKGNATLTTLDVNKYQLTFSNEPVTPENKEVTLYGRYVKQRLFIKDLEGKDLNVQYHNGWALRSGDSIPVNEQIDIRDIDAGYLYSDEVEMKREDRDPSIYPFYRLTMPNKEVTLRLKPYRKLVIDEESRQRIEELSPSDVTHLKPNDKVSFSVSESYDGITTVQLDGKEIQPVEVGYRRKYEIVMPDADATLTVVHKEKHGIRVENRMEQLTYKLSKPLEEICDGDEVLLTVENPQGVGIIVEWRMGAEIAAQKPNQEYKLVITKETPNHLIIRRRPVYHTLTLVNPHKLDIGIWGYVPESQGYQRIKDLTKCDEGQTYQLSSTLNDFYFRENELEISRSDGGELSFRNGGGGYAFVMPKSDLTITIKAKINVYLFKKRLDVWVGHYDKLEGRVFPGGISDRSIRWESLDEQIATVDKEGVVFGVKPGKTQVKAISVLDETCFALCDVYVDEEQTLKAVQFTKKKIQMEIGATRALQVTFIPEVYPERGLKFSVKDPFIATVTENGVVQAQRNGTTEVTVVSTVDEKIKDVCTVTVGEAISLQSIAFKQKKLSLTLGETVTDLVTFTPENATTDPTLEWRIEDPAVVSVDDLGRLTAEKVGSTKVHATSKAINQTISLDVEVVNKVSVSGLTLSKSNLLLSVNEKHTLSVSVLPDNATEKGVLWSSSDDAIATVTENGEVTAKKVGECTITVKSKEKGSEIKKTCLVRVDATVIKVLAIAVAPKSKTLKVGESFTLSAVVAPNNASEQGVTWSSSNEEVATISQTGELTAKAIGNVTIVAKSKEVGSSVEGKCEVSIEAATTEAIQASLLASLSVAPNPFTSQLRLENPEGVAAHYELVNASGLVLRSGAFSATELFIDTEALPAGLYFVRIEAQNGAKKIVRVVKH